ncbi:hypothetical protein AHAS_Ahas11G0121000 [Arachis hypogaea]
MLSGMRQGKSQGHLQKKEEGQKLILEKKLAIPSDLRRYTEPQIEERGWAFLDRKLARVNESWVREFYCIFFRATLDVVHLKDRQIMVTEADIEEILHCQPKISDKDAYQRAKKELHSLTFDYDALRSMVAQPDAPWEMDASKVKPKGMKFEYLMKEARVWQQILAHCIMPSTHFTEIPVDMLVLIGCVIEGKELYLPRLIRRFMWHAHIRVNLPLPSLVMELTHQAGVPWLPDDESPPAVHGKEKVIPWGTWVAAAGPSAVLSTSTRPALPSSAPQLTYRLVQHLLELIDQSERRNKQRYEHLSRMIAALGINMPSDSDTPSDKSEAEEAQQAEAPTQTQAPTETQQTSVEP